ncbi:MAG: TMEM175 family protein [Candidatus Margulisiibacteriota bacterium]|nr:TMEM175 family protein [Candidatus Margulisiibacteriota bacterium]
MVEAEGNKQDLGLTTNRIEALTDGIFAIAMTLQVLSLNLPETASILNEAGLHHLLMDQFDKFFNYARSFLLLAIFWIIHHQQFHSIIRTDRKHLWINIFMLMFVALIPFSTTLVGNFNNDWMAEFFFGGNLFFVGLFIQLNWLYAANNHRLVRRNYPQDKINIGKKRGMITPAISLLAMGISIVNPSLASYTYLLIPIILSLPSLKRRV